MSDSRGYTVGFFVPVVVYDRDREVAVYSFVYILVLFPDSVTVETVDNLVYSIVLINNYRLRVPVLLYGGV